MTNQTTNRSFILHKDSLSVLSKLSDAQKGKLFQAIFDYQTQNILPNEDLISIIFEPFLNQFKRDAEKYKNTCKARKLAGSIGGKQKVANASKSKQKLANLADSDSDSDSDNKKDKDLKNIRFIKPEIEEIRNYCNEILANIDPQRFFDYYQANGWKVGKNSMKDWKACIRTWKSKEQKPKAFQQSKSNLMADTLGIWASKE